MPYDARPDPDGWTVYEIATGQPAEVNGTALIALSAEEADDLIDLLNQLERQSRATQIQ